MRDFTFTLRGDSCKRVNKRVARSAYDFGCEVAICPCNMRPGSPWHPESWAAAADCGNAPFDRIADIVSWYHCNHETGRYPAYYVRAADLDVMALAGAERNAYENACDCLYYGESSSVWCDCGIDPDRRAVIWALAYDRLSRDFRY